MDVILAEFKSLASMPQEAADSECEGEDGVDPFETLCYIIDIKYPKVQSAVGQDTPVEFKEYAQRGFETEVCSCL